jgi:hypothetical protein
MPVRADDITDKSGRHNKLRKVFAPSQVTVGEQHVPVREHEPSLGIWVSSTVEWRRNEPGVEEKDREHRGEDDRITKHFMWPKSVTSARALPLFLCLLQVLFFLHVHGGDSAKVVN